MNLILLIDFFSHIEESKPNHLLLSHTNFVSILPLFNDFKIIFQGSTLKHNWFMMYIIITFMINQLFSIFTMDYL